MRIIRSAQITAIVSVEIATVTRLLMVRHGGRGGGGGGGGFTICRPLTLDNTDNFLAIS